MALVVMYNVPGLYHLQSLVVSMQTEGVVKELEIRRTLILIT